MRDRVAATLARALTAVFYRHIEVQGAGRVPGEGPLLIVANHANAMMDPFLLLAVMPRQVRFLGKSTLWRNPGLRPLLWLAGAIPVFRRQDSADMAQNDRTFERCHEELARGGAIALFPEGVSYHAPELQPLKTGAARIALGAAAAGARNVRIVPVGLTYEAKGVFRSRVLVTVGEPIEPGVADGLPSAADDRTVTRELTTRILDGMRHVTLNQPTWTTHRLVERAVQVYHAPELALPGRSDLGDAFELHQRFGRGYQALRERDPERCAALVDATARYDRLLTDCGLRDDHISARYPWRLVARYLGARVPVLLVWLPVALVGTVLNYLPYRVPGWVSAYFARQSRDLPATLKLLTGFVLFPLVWAVEIAVAGKLWGTWAAVTTAVVAPLSGYAAMRFHEGHRSFWSEVRAYLVLRLRVRRVAELRRLREHIRREVVALVGEGGGP